MAKKRIEVGAVIKSKDAGKPDYIKINQDVVLKKGQFLNLDTKASRLAGLREAVQAGRLPQETADKIAENIEKTPDFVRFSISFLQDS